MGRSWRVPIVFLAVSAAFGGGYGLLGQRLLGLGLFVLGGGYSFVLSPWFFPRSVSADEAHALAAADGRPVVYWRPGCAFCIRLRIRLGRHARRAHWVDIWRDPEGAALVRAVANGNETVPTVVHAGTPVVNPDPAQVLAALRSS